MRDGEVCSIGHGGGERDVAGAWYWKGLPSQTTNYILLFNIMASAHLIRLKESTSQPTYSQQINEGRGSGLEHRFQPLAGACYVQHSQRFDFGRRGTEGKQKNPQRIHLGSNPGYL
jgi:hypothetical protein